ncbi:MAG: transporter substrate-binding domain-containing protein [Desulfobacterales bacterium]|nr:transporter substrate-binding domain-containing protein [Desulfobacterales bacterium]
MLAISKPNWMVIVGLALVTAIWVVVFGPAGAAAQNTHVGVAKLRVGTVEAPPFATQVANGPWEGLSIELWRWIARDLEVAYEFIPYEDSGQLKLDLENGALDVFIAMALTASHEDIFDMSHPFLTSGSSIAVPWIEPRPSLLHFLGQFVDRFLSRELLLMIGVLVLLAFGAGTLVWLFESRRNRDVFTDKTFKGLWQGLWWAVVTMTTVGYGDKAPRTVGGRVVALVWMFTSIILFALFTAAVTASLTVGTLSGKVQGFNDLYGARVGSVARSESLDYLAQHGIGVRAFKSQQDGLQAMIDGEIDAFVFNALTLKNAARTAFNGRIQVLPEIFDPYYVSMAMPPGSTLREPFNQALLTIIETEEWLRLTARYIGLEK